jgi:sporadic carbohydrate cluster 2OG-Fe(II) oxygenase
MNDNTVVTHKAASILDEQPQDFLQDFNKGSWVTDHSENGIFYSSFSPEEFPLREAIVKLFVEKGILKDTNVELEYLHKHLTKEQMSLDHNELNDITKLLYEQNEFFLDAYKSFIKHICKTIIKKPCYFQKTPTIRVHFPHQEGFNWAPRFHTDILLGHPPCEVNIWAPITKTYGTNSLLLIPLAESLSVLNKFKGRFTQIPNEIQTNTELQQLLHKQASSVTLPYGDFVVFDSRCLHACQYNTEETTRISIDVRVVPVDDFNNKQLAYRGSGRRQVAFEVGDYYDVITSEEL